MGNSQANATFPLLLLAGAAETSAGPTRGAFQQLDQVSFLAPHTKLAVRPPSLAQLPSSLRDAYQASFYGRPGPSYVDLPADYIQTALSSSFSTSAPTLAPVPAPPAPSAAPARIAALAAAIRTAKAPLVIVGKGAAYARAEDVLRAFVASTQLPFLPTPQGKGVLPDNDVLNTSAARSTALQNADLILLLGARLNWILHFGERFRRDARVAQVDIHAEELGRGTHGADPDLAIAGDITAVVSQLAGALRGFSHPATSQWRATLKAAAGKNMASALAREGRVTQSGARLTYHRAFSLIQAALHRLVGPAGADDLIYVAEGANTMDIARSVFTVSQPRQRLDAGTYATMGVGLGYAVAAAVVHAGTRKRVVALEGDSAVGFSLAEVETMSRYRMPILIFVLNNGGVYHGLGMGEVEWERDPRREQGVLPPTALGWETRYELVAQGLGGRGWRVETELELTTAVEEAWAHCDGPSVVNVVIESGKGGAVKFNWMNEKPKL